MKVSVISTVYNEELSIKELLNSLLSQSRKPDEIVIVDGGSSDNTTEIIEEYSKKGAPIKLIIEEGVNIARGRNIAIENASYDIIASTDAGCILDKEWLENMLCKFDENTDFVVGNIKACARTDFEKCIVEVMHTNADFNLESVTGQASSTAFRKSIWRTVGGYPEWLNTAEDTKFYLTAKNAGYKVKLAKDAIVYWKMRKNLRELFKQYYLYAKGNGEAGLTNRKNIFNHLSEAFAPIFLLILLPFLNLYLYPVWLFLFLPSIRCYFRDGLKCYRSSKRFKSSVYGSCIRLTVNHAWTFGLISGHTRRKLRGEK